MNSATFQERQRFDQWGLWIIVAILAIAPIITGLFIENRVGIIISLIAAIPLITLLLITRLKTDISEKGIFVKFFPIYVFDKIILWEQIEDIHIRHYNSLGEFGGWGVRISYKHGMAYNVKGKTGIQITFKNGKKLLIGTQKPDEAMKVIDQYFQHPTTPTS